MNCKFKQAKPVIWKYGLVPFFMQIFCDSWLKTWWANVCLLKSYLTLSNWLMKTVTNNTSGLKYELAVKNVTLVVWAEMEDPLHTRISGTPFCARSVNPLKLPHSSSWKNNHILIPLLCLLKSPLSLCLVWISKVNLPTVRLYHNVSNRNPLHCTAQGPDITPCDKIQRANGKKMK